MRSLLRYFSLHFQRESFARHRRLWMRGHFLHEQVLHDNFNEMWLWSGRALLNAQYKISKCLRAINLTLFDNTAIAHSRNAHAFETHFHYEFWYMRVKLTAEEWCKNKCQGTHSAEYEQANSMPTIEVNHSPVVLGNNFSANCIGNWLH